MCIICLEFNRRKDPFDALEMIASSYQEPNSIDKQHLIKLRKHLEEKIWEDDLSPIDPDLD